MTTAHEDLRWMHGLVSTQALREAHEKNVDDQRNVAQLTKIIQDFNDTLGKYGGCYTEVDECHDPAGHLAIEIWAKRDQWGMP